MPDFIFFLLSLLHTITFSYIIESTQVPFTFKHKMESSRNTPNTSLIINSTSNVLIIGGTKHIGLELTKIFASRGATVYASHRSLAVPSTISKLSFYHQSDPVVHNISIDLVDEFSIRRAADSLKKRLNGKCLTHIIHVAGFQHHYYDRSHYSVNKELIKNIWTVNSRGPLFVFQYFRSLLLRNNTSSHPVFAVFSYCGSSQKIRSNSNSKSNFKGYSYSHASSFDALNGTINKIRLKCNNRVMVAALQPNCPDLIITGINEDNMTNTVCRVVNSLDLIQSNYDFYCSDCYRYAFPLSKQ